MKLIAHKLSSWLLGVVLLTIALQLIGDRLVGLPLLHTLVGTGVLALIAGVIWFLTRREAGVPEPPLKSQSGKFGVLPGEAGRALGRTLKPPIRLDKPFEIEVTPHSNAIRARMMAPEHLLIETAVAVEKRLDFKWTVSGVVASKLWLIRWNQAERLQTLAAAGVIHVSQREANDKALGPNNYGISPEMGRGEGNYLRWSLEVFRFLRNNLALDANRFSQQPDTEKVAFVEQLIDRLRDEMASM